MIKGLEILELLKTLPIPNVLDTTMGNYFSKGFNIIEKELKALEIISQNFRLVGNCLHARNPYAEDGWVFVKEIEDEEELEAWKEVLL